MGSITADLRYALRMMRSSPGFTAAAVTALALGIGANTAIFTVIDRVMLRPLPYKQPDRIMRLGRQFPGGKGYSNSIPKYMVWRNNDVFETMAIYGQTGPGMSFGTGDRAQQVKTQQVSKGYFRVFGGVPALGRTFNDAEDLPHGPLVAVLNYTFWQNRLGGDPQIVGRTVVLNKQAYTVIGIMERGFESAPPCDLWVPLQADPNSTNQGHYLAVAGRLKPGVTLSQARAAMKVAGERFRQANPKWMDATESVAVVPMQESMVENVRLALLVLFGAVGFVLLIACANVANLLLARAAVRARELALRAAIGASRWRMIRQLLTESVVLAAISSILGFALGAGGVRLLLLVAPGNIPRLTDPDTIQQPGAVVDWRIAAFTIAVAVLTGVLFGLFPALRISNPDLASSLKEGGRSSTGLHNRARSVLVVTEVALAIVLLTGAALLIRTFAGLRAVQPGFNAHHLLALETSLSSGDYSTTERTSQFAIQVTRRIEALPGAQAATSAIMLPLTGQDIDLPFNIAGHPPAKGDYNGDEQYRAVSAHYFRALEIPLLRGRTFTDADTGSSARIAIINDSMAKHYWPKQNPIGQVIVIGKGLGPQFDDQPREIVGVVGDVHETGLSSKDLGVMYIPQTQMPDGITKLANSVLPLSFAVRTAADPMSLRSAIEREVQSVDGTISASRVRTMEQVISESLSRENFNTLLLSIFAAIAVLLAAIGIYGLMSYSVEQRTQEIGIRVALGAGRPEVLRLILVRGMILSGIGVVAGLAASFFITRLLASFLFGIKATDPATFAAVALTITVIAFLASWIPARRAAAVAPAVALRHQ